MPVKRKFQLLIKTETSEGISSNPGASDAVLAYDPEPSDGPELLDRVPTGPSLSRDFRPVGRNSAQLAFKQDFRGSGDTSIPVDAPDWARSLETSGFKRVSPTALTMPSPTGTGWQVGEIVSQSAGAVRALVVGCFAAGVLTRRLTAAGTVVVVPIVGIPTAAATTGESSGTTATASAAAAYAGVAYAPTSRRLFNIVTAAACAVAVGETVTIERAGLVVGSAQVVVNNSGFTNVDCTLLYGEVANGDTVRAAAGGTTTISTGPTQTETPSVTASFNEDGERSLLLGGRADWTLGGAVGEPLQFQFTLRGDVGPIVDAAPIATGALSTIAAPRMLGAICSFGRGAEIYALATKDVQIAAGAQVEPNLDANRAGGSIGSNVVDRVPEITVTVDRTNSAFPWRTLRDASTPVRAAFLLGTTPGQIVGVIAPRCQATEVSRGDASGINTWSVKLNPSRILETGDDELFLVQL
jgi:hypothetical protein